MSLYAWKYDGDDTIVYTLSVEPSGGDYIYKENGTQYEEFELQILFNGEIEVFVNSTINDLIIDPETLIPNIQLVAIISSRPRPVNFARYSSGDIFPISKLKHNNITYEIVDEQARDSISNILPTQTGNSGKFLTTNGTTTSWANVDALPSQSGQSGKYLTTNGTSTSWGTIDALPSQSGQSGKYLTTDGSSASWATVQAGPKFLSFTNVTASTWVSDSTYTGYGYKCVLTCTGTTSSDYAQVIFGPDQANSGNYINVCLTGTDSVTIYSKVNTSISIPTIVVMGA